MSEGAGVAPDWLAVSDATEAWAILDEVIEWLDRIGRYEEIEPVPCWPWHPGAVALLQAAIRHWRAVYAGDSPKAVTDYLIEYLSAIQATLAEMLKDCSEREHHEGDKRYRADSTQLSQLAVWWTSGRDGLAPGLSLIWR